MLSEVDDDLIGATNRLDPMGVLAIWTERGRDLVPHLTAQTNKICGFQILVEAFRLWERYEQEYAEHDDQLDDFFVLVEQAFAHTVGWYYDKWELPGARRVRTRSQDSPQFSIRDRRLHLLNNQKGGGLWGLYRGASQRAGMLVEDMSRLSDETLTAAKVNHAISYKEATGFLELLKSAMAGNTKTLAQKRNNQLTRSLYNTYTQIPLRSYFRDCLIKSDELTNELASRLLAQDEIDRRSFLQNAAQELPRHRVKIQNAIRCEDILAIVEAIFFKLCTSTGKSFDEVELRLDLSDFQAALMAFGKSGTYGGTASTRHTQYQELLDPSDHESLMRSVLKLHDSVCKGKGQSSWIWVEDSGKLSSDTELDAPSDDELTVGLAWRNDYYLQPLQSIVKQLQEIEN